VDHKQLAENFFEAIGWDTETMMPDKDSLEDINDVAEKMHARQVHGRWVCAFD